MRYKLVILIFSFALTSVLLKGAVFGQTLPTEVYTSPEITEATIYETLTLGVWVRNVVNLTAFTLELDYDPESVEVLSVTNGGFLDENNAIIEPTNGIYPETGKVKFGLALIGSGGETNPSSGEGKLIEVTLRSKTFCNIVPFSIDDTVSSLINWPEGLPVPFSVIDPTVVHVSPCAMLYLPIIRR